MHRHRRPSKRGKFALSHKNPETVFFWQISYKNQAFGQFFGPRKGSPMPMNVVLVLGVVVIRFSILLNLFISQSIVTKLRIQTGDNILQIRTMSDF